MGCKCSSICFPVLRHKNMSSRQNSHPLPNPNSMFFCQEPTLEDKAREKNGPCFDDGFYACQGDRGKKVGIFVFSVGARKYRYKDQHRKTRRKRWFRADWGNFAMRRNKFCPRLYATIFVSKLYLLNI